MASLTFTRAGTVVAECKRGHCLNKALPVVVRSLATRSSRLASNLGAQRPVVIKRGRLVTVQAQAQGQGGGLAIDLRGERRLGS
jgi:hypothetical protein